MIDPFLHAKNATGHPQVRLVDALHTSGVAAALSEVSGPHLYDYRPVPYPVVSLTLYDVARHVLKVDGKVRREGRVRSGRFRIGQPGQHIVVDAIPGAKPLRLRRNLLLFYLDPLRMTQVRGGARTGATFRDEPWDIEDLFLHQIALRLVEVAGSGELVEQLLVEQLGVTVGLHLLAHYSVDPTRPSPSPSRLPPIALSRVVDFIQTPAGLRASLSELAGLVGFSASHFLRLFQAATGETPHQFVQRQRIERAREMLARTDRRLSEIGLACGYASQAHFGTKFRQATGFTPRQYREITRGR